MKEEYRKSGGQRLVESVARDVVYALRVLRKSPGFTTAVVLSLALGIGANTAIFTPMDAVMWRMLPVKDPEHPPVGAGSKATPSGPGSLTVSTACCGQQCAGEPGRYATAPST